MHIIHVQQIAIHIGLLRQGYAQGNLFPFMEEMRKVKEMEEAVCYSPDVSKFTGGKRFIKNLFLYVDRLIDTHTHIHMHVPVHMC